MPRQNYHSAFQRKEDAPAFLGVNIGQQSDPMPALMRELIDEIRGLRADLRKEVLQREISKLPAPIREA